jgi:3-oxoacyl-[acyl-carrier-protein] synthase-3
MPTTRADLAAHLLARIALVRRNLGYDDSSAIPIEARFAEVLDSMGMVEFLGIVADDCGVALTKIEECASRRFGTIAELAASMAVSGINVIPAPGIGTPRDEAGATHAAQRAALKLVERPVWLGGITTRLPTVVQSAGALDSLLHRPAGWLEQHAGIRSRRVWAEEDPIQAVAECGSLCMQQSVLSAGEVGALLVTSEAPPRPLGLAADLHHRLDLPPGTPALEIGGACTGFLAALWVARSLLSHLRSVLILTVEAPSRYLQVAPGPAGEAAALFGDGAAAALLSADAPRSAGTPLWDVTLACHGEAADLIRVLEPIERVIELHMDGPVLAHRAIRAMTQNVRDLAGRHQLRLTDFEGVIVHGGNGRMPGLVARQLGLKVDRVWSCTAETGNLGSASLPVAWAGRQPLPQVPVIWTAAGAGMTSGAALTGKVHKV